MFDEEDEDDFEGTLREDLERFEAHLRGDSLGFMDSDRLEMIIDHYLINSQYQKARVCAEYALARFPFLPLFQLRKAQAISAMGQLKEALHVLAKIEKLEPQSCEFYLTKASIFSQLRDRKNAIRYFEDALRLSEPEDRDEIYLDLAMEYQNARDFKNAIRILREAIDSNPHHEGALYEIAFCYDQMGEYEQAIQCYSDFIDENPYSFTAWYNLGNAYSKLDKFEKAIWAYDYSILINEDFGPVYFNMATVYMSMEQFERAIEAFLKCIEMDGEDATALCYLGESYEQLNQLEEAKKCYLKSIDLSPNYADAWLGLGIVYDLEEKTVESLPFLHKALQLDPTNAGVLHVLAGANEKIGNADEAMGFYQQAVELDPTDEECLTSYINLWQEYSLIEPLNFLLSQLELQPNNLIVKLLLTSSFWKNGSYQEALTLFTECVAADSTKSKELFKLNPDLLNVHEFVILID